MCSRLFAVFSSWLDLYSADTTQQGKMFWCDWRERWIYRRSAIRSRTTMYSVNVGILLLQGRADRGSALQESGGRLLLAENGTHSS